MDEPWRARIARVPDWAWLAGIVVASAALRVWLVRAMPAPFVFVDELIYSELAKSVADAGSFAVRGVPTSGYSTLYPLLLAPAYALFDALPNAYALAKATNAVAMSLAAVPAWLVTRRVAGRGLSLVCAVIAVAIPSMAYTATVVTETLFYPLALLFAWTLLRVLERPSGGRLAVLAAALVAAVATRSRRSCSRCCGATRRCFAALRRSSAARSGWACSSSSRSSRAAGRSPISSAPTASSARAATTRAACSASGSGTSRS